MALLHLDSADHYDTATAIVKWFTAPTIVAGGRTGKGFKGGVKVFNATSSMTFGVAVKGTSAGLFTLTNVAADLTLIITWASDSRFQVSFGHAGDRALSDWSPVTVCRANWWYYFEIQTNYSVEYVPTGLLHYAHTVSFVLKINEETILTDSLSWLDVQSDVGFTRLDFPSVLSATIFDDFYMTDGEFLGDGRIYVIRPNADGDYSEWVAKSGGAQYLEVKDINPDYDSTYISTADLDKISMVNLEDISIVGDIKGLQINTVGEKDDSGGAAFKQYNKFNGSYIEGTETIYPSYLNWLDQMCAFRKNPVTGLDFTQAEVNAMQAGVKRVI